jgi:glucose dehydrogenase
MYVITPRNQVFALDATTGKVVWQYKPATPQPGHPGGEVFALNRGVAISGAKNSVRGHAASFFRPYS